MNRFDLRVQYGLFDLNAAMEWEAPIAALFGASGSGKTTILEALAGVRPEVAGTVLLGGRRLEDEPAAARDVGWVPQDASLFPHMSVAENLEFARRARGRESHWAEDAVEVLEIGHLLEKRATELSGGERQRVAIVRALASRPEFLLLDEPLASIDRPLRVRVLPFLRELPERTGLPILFVSHDPLEVAALAGHVGLVERGRIVESGEPHAVFASAATFGALWALGAENRFQVRVAGRKNGMLVVETPGGARLAMVSVEGFPAPAHVALRAEDILLSADPPGRVSAQNVLVGHIRRADIRGERVDLEIEHSGEIWRARVTLAAATKLGLEPNGGVYMLVKAHAIVPCG